MSDVLKTNCSCLILPDAIRCAHALINDRFSSLILYNISKYQGFNQPLLRAKIKATTTKSVDEDEYDDDDVAMYKIRFGSQYIFLIQLYVCVCVLNSLFIITNGYNFNCFAQLVYMCLAAQLLCLLVFILFNFLLRSLDRKTHTHKTQRTGLRGKSGRQMAQKGAIDTFQIRILYA